jgi:signal transduction histidine kinase/CheY-like chemotaxis protein
MPLSAKARFELGIAVSLAAVLAVSLLSYQSLGRLIASSRWTAQAFEVLARLEAVGAHFRRAESQASRHVLTGDVNLLDRFHQSIAEIEPILDEIQSLTRDNPEQQGRLARLRPLIQRRIQDYVEIVEMSQREGLERAAEEVRVRELSQPSQRIQALVDEMESAERRLALDRERRLLAQSRTARWAVVLGAVLAALLLASAWLVARRELERRLAAQEDLRRAKTAADAANVAKSAFLANMSHELRTPLNAIIGFSEVLVDRKFGDLNEQQESYVGHVLESGQHLLRLINDVLDLSKVEADRMDLHLEPCDLPEVVGEVVGTLQEMTSAKGVSLTVSLDALPLVADVGRLKQILYNLLSNAIKFTPAGGSVTVRSAVESLPSPSLRVSVADTGIGIRPEDQERVFREFEQIDSAYARAQRGTGLGLALTRRLVELHGGRLWLESEGEGHGSTFHFTLPLRAAVPAAVSAASIQPQPSVPPLPVRERRLVLVAEDDPAARELLGLWLGEAGYDVAEAADGEQAVRMAQELRPDAVTLDIVLPRQDGWQVLAELKSQPETRGIPVVIHSITEDRGLGFTLGATEFLVKPVDRERLLEAVSAAMTARAAETRTVLVADDEIPTLEWLTALLEGEGYQVLRAPGGREAIEQAREHLPHLIILDLIMPEMSGFDVVWELRQQERTGEIPIIIFTAKEITPEDRERLNSKVQAISSKGATARQDLMRELAKLVVIPGPANRS